MAVLTSPLSASEVQKAKPGATEYELFNGQGLILSVRSSGYIIMVFSLQALRFGFRNHHYPGVLSHHVVCQRPDTAR